MTVQLNLPKDVERELVADVRSGRHATLQEAILERISRSRDSHRLAVGRKAESKSFAQIMGPVRKAAGKVDEDEIVRLVDRARGRGRQRPRRKSGKKR